MMWYIEFNKMMWYIEFNKTLYLGLWWYTWTSSHPIRDPLGLSSLKEGMVGAIGE
jgi:hypothetical protein